MTGNVDYVILFPEPSHAPVHVEEVSSVLQRMSAGGMIVVESFMPVEDPSPPGRIADLSVWCLSYTNRTATFVWTAPGDDFYNGRGTY